MIKYIVLLRGINVGGNNKVPMSLLKEQLEKLGYIDVITYINSGNVLLNSEKPKEELVKEITIMLKNSFSFTIDFVLITATFLAEAFKEAPDWWGNNDKFKHNAIFLLDTIKIEEVINQIGEIRSQYERFEVSDNVIFWSNEIENAAKTKWSKIVGMKFYKMVTIRNSNTVKKLLELSNSPI